MKNKRFYSFVNIFLVLNPFFPGSGSVIKMIRIRKTASGCE